MRNKRSKINEEASQRLLNPLNKNLNLKNREQLRKKLKGLLEKDKTNLHLLASDKQNVRSNPKVVKDLPKKNTDENVLKNKRPSQVSKASIIKPKTSNRAATPNASKRNLKGKNSGVSLKRKSKDKLEPPKKTSKLFKSSPATKNISPSKVQTQKTTSPRVTPNVTRKAVGKCPTVVKSLPKKKTEKTKKLVNTSNGIKNTKLTQLQPKKKTKLVSKQKSTQNVKTKTVKKTPIERKTNVKPYRGPFRPDTPESDSHESLWINLPTEQNPEQTVKRADVQKVINNEQALTRVDYDNESSSDEDGDYYSEHYEYSPADKCYSCSDDDSFPSDDDSSYWQNTTSSDGSISYDSESDRTYELPGNVAEDVYVANGTAVKHDFSENNEVDFDSDTSTAQIIEMPTASRTPQAATKSSVTSSEPSKDTTNVNQIDNKICESDDSCPELVPIDYKNNIHDDSDSDFSSHCWSISGSGSDTDTGSFSEASESSVQPPQMTPEIFQADKAAKEEFEIDFLHVVNPPSRNYIRGSLLDRIANPKSNTSSYKVITTNNEIVNTEKVTPKTIKTRPGKPVLNNISSTENKVNPPGTTATPITTKINEVPSEKPMVKASIGQTPTVDATFVNRETETPLKTGTPPKKISQDKPAFRTLFFNAINSNQVIVLLKDPLYVYGTVKLKLFAGSLEIFGYNPKRNEVLEIFSPRGYSSLKIEASPNSAMNTSVNEKELLSLTPYFIRTELEEIIEKFDPRRDAIVILERNDRSKRVNMLRKYMVEHLFPNMNSIQSDRPFYTSEFLLRCILTPKTDKALIVDPRWRTITATNNSRVMVIGGKSVGKSTLVRYLVNRNLNKYPKILLIDLDIGQPEIFAPQTVSATTLTTPLLGPGYFLNKEPDKAFLVGQTNIVLLPQRYIENVQALMEYCKGNTEYRDIPWIVNTMGYNKGFGDELIAVICNLLHPTNIVQLESNREINNFDVIMSKENLESMEWNIIGDMFSSGAVFRPQHHLTLMPSVIPNDRKYQKEWDMNPRDMRLAMIISRLSTILKGHAEWLTDIKPVCASTDDLKIVNLGDDQINTEDLLQALVGNLIYLCRQDTAGHSIECLGIGIVRGVDYPLKQIYLLPAVPLEVLKSVNCLAICGIPLPSSILINQGPKVKGVASYVYNTVNKAASMYIQQIYHRPKHFLTGRHKSIAE